MYLTFRVEKDSTKEQRAAYEEAARNAFRTYAISNPVCGDQGPLIKGNPHMEIEALASRIPFTSEGFVRGLCARPINNWWHGAIGAVMTELQKQFDGRGVRIIMEEGGNKMIGPLSEADAA